MDKLEILECELWELENKIVEKKERGEDVGFLENEVERVEEEIDDIKVDRLYKSGMRNYGYEEVDWCGDLD